MFPSFSRKKPIVGLDIGSNSVKLVQIGEIRGEYFLEKIAVKPLGPDVIVDGTIMDAASVSEVIKSLMEETKLKCKDVTMSVSGHSVIVKKINIPFMTEEEISESIKWEAEQYIPFDINDVFIDFAVMHWDKPLQASEQMNILLVAAKKEKLNEYMAVAMDCGLNPVIVDVDVFALENMFCVNYEMVENEVVAIVNIGASVMNIIILKGGYFAFTRDISIGGLRFTEEIQKELGLSYEDAESFKCGNVPEGFSDKQVELMEGVVSNLNTEVASEILRSFDFFRSSSTGEQVAKIYLSGGGSRIKGLQEFLEEKLEMEVKMLDPFARINIEKSGYSREDIGNFSEFIGVCVGLALRRVGDI